MDLGAKVNLNDATLASIEAAHNSALAALEAEASTALTQSNQKLRLVRRETDAELQRAAGEIAVLKQASRRLLPGRSNRA